MEQWLIIFLLLTAWFIWSVIRVGKASDAPLLDMTGNEVQPTRFGALGTHLHGLGIGNEEVLFVVTETDLLFNVVFPKKRVLEQFPHKNLKGIEVQDARQITKRITATRLAAIGLFALAVPKKETDEKAFLMLEWQDETGLRQAVFSEEGPGALGRADMHAARLRKTLKEVSNQTI